MGAREGPIAVDFIARALAWAADPAHWVGSDGIAARLGEHLVLSAVPLVAAVLVALPVGLYIGHTGRGAAIAVNVSNIGRALPSLGILGIALILVPSGPLPFGVLATMFALFALALPPIVLNTYTGLREVERDLLEAGRGMGMREPQLLTRVEVPLALPIILAGLRTSAVQVVATATLGAVFGTGGLGRLIVDGIKQQDDAQLFVGAVIVALLSIGTELAFAGLQRASMSPGLRSARTPRGASEAELRPSA
ncbi:MAG: ABC transporter permease [Candidatus Limnocylindria bacterium]